ncbi:hypothetical protein, partial [Sphingobium yanoikuyae]|uniref:hypothetical protein n=1 Tax=Sphingobium yanoikuyae TaxID=13690 RepID=UPI002FDD7744
PAGSCTGGFRTQAPETLHNIRRSSEGAETSACAKTYRYAESDLPGCNARISPFCATPLRSNYCAWD